MPPSAAKVLFTSGGSIPGLPWLRSDLWFLNRLHGIGQRWAIQVSDLSASDGRVLAYQGHDG